MNKQGTETGISDLSKSSGHLMDFRDPVSGCSVYVLVCPDHTQHDLLGKNSLQLLHLHSQATCGAVCLSARISRVPVAFECLDSPLQFFM